MAEPFHKVETKLEVLALLVRLQKECAPIKLSIGHLGYAGNHVGHHTITIHEAPPSVVKALIGEGLIPDVVEGNGLRLYFRE